MSFVFPHMPVNKPGTTHQDEEQEQSVNSESELPSPQTGHPEGGEEEEGEEGETYEEGQEVEEEEEPCEETPEEEEVKVEWPTGVPQASDKDLAKLSHTEGVGIHPVSAGLLLICLLPHLIIITRGGGVITPPPNDHSILVKQTCHRT